MLLKVALVVQLVLQEVVGFVEVSKCRKNLLVTARRSSNRERVTMMPQGVPQVPYQPPGSDYIMWTDIYQRLYRERVLLVGNFLDEDQANQLIAILLYLRYDSPSKPISIYFNVPGALMKPCLAIFDTIQSLSCPVSTVNLGLATGMGAFLCGAGTKGMRYALPNARFLMQRTGLDDPYQGQATDIGLIVQENKRDNDRMERALAIITGQSVETIKSDLKRDFYLSADEAVKYGLIDSVLVPQPKSMAQYSGDIGINMDPYGKPPPGVGLV